jgi:SAM-dependent methyltransferase
MRRHESVAGGGPRILTPAYYQRLNELEREHGWFRGMRAFGAALLDPLLGNGTSWRVLDAGCGTGSMLDWLRRYPGAAAVGVDVSRDALRFCRRSDHRELTQTSVMDLPFPDATFDLIVCTDVLQHLPEPRGDGAALTELFRVLRPAGYLYVRTNCTLGSGTVDAGDRTDYRQYTRAILGQRVRAAGFTIERSSYANTLPSLLAMWRPLGRSKRNGAALHLQPRPARLRWIDTLLAYLLRAEAAHLRFRRYGLPCGSSLLVLARKPRS